MLYTGPGIYPLMISGDRAESNRRHFFNFSLINCWNTSLKHPSILWLVTMRDFLLTGRVCLPLSVLFLIDICRVASIVFKKSLETYALPQAIDLPRQKRSQLGGGAFPVFVWSHRNSFCKIESKSLNSMVLAGGFAKGCAKKRLGFKHI